MLVCKVSLPRTQWNMELLLDNSSGKTSLMLLFRTIWKRCMQQVLQIVVWCCLLLFLCDGWYSGHISNTLGGESSRINKYSFKKRKMNFLLVDLSLHVISLLF